MRILTTLLMITIALAANGRSFALQAHSSVSDESIPSSLTVMQDDGLTLGQAIDKVRRQYNGRIVDAKTRCSSGRETHVIKVLTQDGKVKTVRVPGKRCS